MHVDNCDGPVNVPYVNMSLVFLVTEKRFASMNLVYVTMYFGEYNFDF